MIRRLSEGIGGATDELDRFEVGDFSGRVSTSLRKLDQRLHGGFRPGQLTLVGAPTGGGKTTLVQQIAVEAARNGPVLLVSPEMSLEELCERELVRSSGVARWERNPWTRNPDARDRAAQAHIKAAGLMSTEHLPLFILDDTDATMVGIQEAAQVVHAEAQKDSGLRLIVIDYAQQVADFASNKARYLQVGEVGTAGVAMALAFHVPVIIASQVNTIRDGGTKTFAFRETAILEHKAAVVLVFDVDWDEVDEERFVKSARILCTKNRSGAPFRLPVHYEPSLYRIADLESDGETYSSVPKVGPQWNQ